LSEWILLKLVEEEKNNVTIPMTMRMKIQEIRVCIASASNSAVSRRDRVRE